MFYYNSRSQSGGGRTVESGRGSTSGGCLSFRKLRTGRSSESGGASPDPTAAAAAASPDPAPEPDRIIKHEIYGPDNLGIEDDEASADRDLEGGIGKELLAKIHICYERVKFDHIAFCFGLLDPVSNIVVGQAIALSEKLLVKAEQADVEKEEEEEQALLPPPPTSQPKESQYDRSLDGLVAFLVALFPYLTVYRAMWYLNKADLDPFVAARIIIYHRGMERTFGTLSDTTGAAVGTALRCAAAAAQHPNPRRFALGWKLLSPFLREVANKLLRHSSIHDPSELPEIILLIGRQSPRPTLLSLEQTWDLASARQRSNKQHPELPPAPRPTLKRMLLATIHGYYLQALAWLPKDKLCSHYHYSLLQAGHCYGPLDPVSNIILNTLWYHHEYPLKLDTKVEIESIATSSLLRIAVRSLYGLVSFLCTCYPDLTPGEAMLRLQLAGANLQKAHDPSGLDASVQVEAYFAAARAAHHQKPRRQAQFLGPSNNMLSAFSLILTALKPGKVRPFLLDNFPTLVARSKPEVTTNMNVLSPWDYSFVKRTIDDFWNKHNRAVRMVKSAIETYSKQDGVPKYELHVICGVNEFVGGSLDAAPFGRTYSCSHINFLATKTKTAGALPELFFAQCPNPGTNGSVALCCPVAMPRPGTEQARCPYCELAGNRIVHPAMESFQGRSRMLEKLLRRKGVYSEGRTTNGIISGSHIKTLWVDFLEEDQIYGDYRCDKDKVEENFPRDDME